MKLSDYIVEVKEYDFKKSKEEFSKEDMKKYHDDLFDIIEDFRGHVNQNEKTKTILFLLISARKEMVAYIEK